ncbi:MAG: TMEM165/GDT1 family protein [Candidatus Nanopelagicales bacterium]
MELVPFFVTFGLVFLSELPDKTAIATLVLSSRYRGQWVFVGVAVAFFFQVIIAVVAGTFIAKLPQRPVEIAVSIVFLISAVLLWRESMKHTAEDEEAEEAEVEAELDERGQGKSADSAKASKGFLKIASMSFMIVFVAEFLDLTQIMTANLAIKYQTPLAVGLGAFLALCSVAAIAIIGGKALLKVLPLKIITRGASILLFCLAIYSLYEALSA